MKYRIINFNFNDVKVKDFFDFIKDRHEVYYSKNILNNSYPYTDNKILQQFKFTNVFRELDSTTIYIIDKLKEIKNLVNGDEDYKNKVVFLNTVYARLFNVIGMFDNLDKSLFYLPLDFKVNDINIEFNKKRNAGIRLQNTAYLISQTNFINYEKGDKRNEKSYQFLLMLSSIKDSIDNFYELLQDCKDIRSVINTIYTVKCVGLFLASQIALDLYYLDFFKNKNLFTDNDYIIVGPGAKPSLDYICDLSEGGLKYDENYENACERLYQIQTDYLNFEEDLWKNTKLKYPIKDGNKMISRMNIQNCLCEFRKYNNFKNNTGRRKYYREFKNSN